MNNKNKQNTHTPEFLKEFGNRVRTLRKEKGLSINEAAEKMKVKRPTYSSWELGYRIPQSKSLQELAKLLDTHESYLMQTSDNPTPTSNNLNQLFEVENVVFDDHVLTEKEIELTTIFLKSLISNTKK